VHTLGGTTTPAQTVVLPAAPNRCGLAVPAFEEKTVDRTGPSVLYSLTELSEFNAASGY